MGYDSIHTELSEENMPDSQSDHNINQNNEYINSPQAEWDSEKVLSPLCAPEEFEANLCELTPGSTESDEAVRQNYTLFGCRGHKSCQFETRKLLLFQLDMVILPTL